MNFKKLHNCFTSLLQRRSAYLTEDSVRYYFFVSMLQQDCDLNHYIMELPFESMLPSSSSVSSLPITINPTVSLKKIKNRFLQELDLFYEGPNEVLCVEFKFHHKTNSTFAHTDAAGKIFNDLKRLRLIQSRTTKNMHRILVYVTDDEMHNYLSYSKKGGFNHCYRSRLATFYQVGGLFDCKKITTPDTFLECANTSFNIASQRMPFSIIASKTFSTNFPIAPNTYTGLYGSCYISVFEV